MDPIGLAGGLNQYGFAAGDPVGGGDPYGLRVCFEGRTQMDQQRLADDVMQATGTMFALDGSGCTDESVTMPGADAKVADAFAELAHSEQTYTFVEGRAPGSGWPQLGSGFDDRGAKTIYINRGDALAYYGVTPVGTTPSGQTICQATGNSRYRLDQIIIHEMGHAYAFESGVSRTRNDPAMTFERSYQARFGLPSRPDACHF